ncbi:MAG: patatin-like phospholipase family protein [Thiomonas sp.]
MTTTSKTQRTREANGNTQCDFKPPGQIVLVFQGGGALGAFQAGVYEALHDAGIEPDWVVGTSIGAINGALISGNARERRLPRLREFWKRVSSHASPMRHWHAASATRMMHNMTTVTHGIPGFFSPNPGAWLGAQMPLGVTRAAYYTTDPLRETLADLVAFNPGAGSKTRLTLGAVNVRNGRMRYFDSHVEDIGLDHILASGALPPAFPAVMIDGEPYWDGGLYSNTPIEVVMRDNPRRDSLIFSAQLWQQNSEAPESIAQVMSRQKDIQYASRAEGQIGMQQEAHSLRHAIRELGELLPDSVKNRAATHKLLSYGCGTVMHVAELCTPALDGEDHTKDIDFTPASVQARWQAGREQARLMIESAPWAAPCDPMTGIMMHRVGQG